MKLSEIGEFHFIDRLKALFRTEMPSGVVGIGDDCAVIPRELVDREMLVTSDLLVEGTHFLRDATSPFDLGYKTLAVNLSDVAAMGGRPQFAFLSLALPKDVEWEWVEGFLKGFRSIARESSVALLGGDTTKSENIFINVTVIGSGPRRQIKRRTSAELGDIVAVTGFLGDSAAGLNLIREKIDRFKDLEKMELSPEELLVHRHLKPRPHIQEGLWLGRQIEVHAMMDVSDGIHSDLERLKEQSSCGFEIDLDQLPISKELASIAQKYNWSVDELATCGGEDYVLLITADPERFERLSEFFNSEFGRPLFQIGRVVGGARNIRFVRGGRDFKLSESGFDHFR